MAHIVDVRNAGGEFVILGDSFTLPTTEVDSPNAMPGSLRFNSKEARVEAKIATQGGSTIWTQVATADVMAKLYLSLGGGTIAGKLVVTGDIETTSTIKAAAFDGTAVSAIYGADLAERYHADALYDAGTVLVIGGPREVTHCTHEADTAVAGIVSTAPAYGMNLGAGPDSTHPLLALRGRVPCKVIGPVQRGAMLVTSGVPGHAMQAPSGAHPRAVIGLALSGFSGETGVIEVLV